LPPTPNFNQDKEECLLQFKQQKPH